MPPPDERVATRAQAVGHGADDLAHSSVGKLTSVGLPSCSGVLITPLWVLTAHHCVAPGAKNVSVGVGGDLCADGSADNRGATYRFDLSPDGGGADATLLFNHTAALSGPIPTPTEVVDLCPAPTPQDAFWDLALVRLDTRVPASVARATPIDALAGGPACPSAGSFTVVGYGGRCGTLVAGAFPCPDGPRSAATSPGWQVNTASWGASGDVMVWRNGFALGQVLDLAIGQVPVAHEPYKGTLPGDSGGGLFFGDSLCGINSKYYPGVDFREVCSPAVELPDPIPDIPPQCLDAVPILAVNSVHADVASPGALAWLRKFPVLDDRGEWLGACSSGPEAFRDFDSDCDGLPDACDPCVYVPDPTYRATGKLGAPFANADGTLVDDDGDGVPNVCDNCPATPNPLVSVPGALVAPKAPPPSPGCGAANLPVAQHLEQLDGDTDGLGDACDHCPLFDAVCCTSDADCNPRTNRGLRCRPMPTGVAWPPPIGGSGGHPCQGGSMCEASLDSDGDGVGDRCDNCPRQNNPTQADADADGLGDACDKCAAVSDATAGALVACTVPAPAASIAVADVPCVAQANRKDSACVRLGDGSGACSFGRDADQDGVGDHCDNCKTTPNLDQANCNLHIEVQQGVAFPYVGDACDREPCARVLVDTTTVASGPQDDNWVKLRLEPILLPSGAPGAYATGPFATPRVDVGLRACACPLPSGTVGDSSALASLCAGDCPFDPSLFGQPLPWRPVDVAASSESGDPPQGTNFSSGAFLPSSIYPNRPLSAPGAPAVPSFVEWDLSRFPAAGPLGTTSSFCKAGFGLRGVLWASAQQVTNIPAMNTVAQLAHHYAGGTLGEPVKCTPPPPTAVAPCFLCGDVCSSCSLKEMGFLTMAEMEEPGFDPASHVWGISGAQRFVAEVDDEVRLARATPGTVLLTPSDGFAHRSDLLGALVRRVGPMTIVGLSVRGDRMSVARTVIVSPPDGDSATLRQSASANGTPAAPPTLTGQATVLSSRERSVFVLGGRDAEGGPSASVWQLALDSGLWFEARVTGSRPGSVAAAAFRSEDRSFYVIDEVKLGPLSMARLLRISLDDLRSTVLGAWPRVRRFDDTYLSVAEDGDLLLAASGGPGSRGKTWFTKLDVDGPRLDLRWARQEKGHLVAVPVLSRRGLTAWYDGGVGRFVDADDLAPRGRWPHTLGECF